MFVRAITVCAAGLVLLLGSHAHAVTVDCSSDIADTVCSETRTVVGSDFSVLAFDVVAAGFYNLDLIDYLWPSEPFSTLSALLTTSAGTVDSLDGAGSLLFFAAPGRYFLQVFAEVGAGASVGLYGVNVTLSPVPVPPALLLLGSACALFAATSYRRRRSGTALAAADLAPA